MTSSFRNTRFSNEILPSSRAIIIQSTGTVYFVSAEKEVHFPEHAHAEQWTIVVSGKCLLTMDGATRTYQQGDTYVIPGNKKHQITLCAVYAEVDYVDDPCDGEA